MPLDLPFLTISSGGLDEFLLMSGETSPLHRLTSWIPAIAVEGTSEVGNSPFYTDIEENMSFNYRSTVVASGYQAMQKLERMLQNAERWDDGENVNPTVIKFQPKGSILSVPLHAVIKGRTDKEKSSTQLSDYLKAGTWKGLLDQNISFIRRGQWHTTRENSTTSSAQATGQVHTLTFPSASPDYVPVDIVLSSASQNYFFPRYMLVICASTLNNALERMGVSTATASGFTSIADVGTQPTGDLLRYTPTGTSFATSGFISFSTAVANKITPNSLVHLYAMVRSNSTSVEWLVKAQYSTSTGSGIHPVSSPVIVDTSTNLPRIMHIATLSPGINAGAFTTNGIFLQVQASTASSSLDFENLYILVENDKAVNVMYSSTTNNDFNHSAPFSVAVKTNPLTLPEPTATTYVTANERKVSNIDLRGDKWLNHIGTQYNVLFAATTHFAGSGYWRLYDVLAASVVNFTAKATRYNSYLVPE